MTSAPLLFLPFLVSNVLAASDTARSHLQDLARAHRMEVREPVEALLPGGGTRVVADAVHAGYPVLGAGIRLFYAPDGTERLTRVRPVPDLPPLDQEPPAGEGELLWREVDGAWRLVRMVVEMGIPGEVRVEDPWTGAILDAWPLMRRDTAPAQVYDFAPTDGEMIEVELPNLDRDDMLQGEYLTAASTTRSGDFSPIHPSDGDGGYFYDTEDAEFAGVMAYWHVEQARAAAWAWEPDLELDDPGYALVNYPEPNAGCAYDGGVLYLIFGDEYSYYGTTLFDFTYESSVMFHEFGHYILMKITDFNDAYQSNNYFVSVEEAFADFWAFSHTGHATIGEYIWAHVDAYQRDQSEDRFYPDDYSSRGDPHENGRILGSMAWDVLQAVGPDLIPVFMGALRYVEGGSDDMHLVIDGMLATDEDLYGYAHGAAILAEAIQHGLEPMGGMGDAPSVAVEVRANLGEGTHTPVLLHADTGDDAVSWYWTLDEVPEDAGSATILNPTSQDAWLVPDGRGDYAVTLRAMSADHGLSEPISLVVEVSPKVNQGVCSTAGPGAGSLAGLAGLAGLVGLARRRRRA